MNRVAPIYFTGSRNVGSSRLRRGSASFLQEACLFYLGGALAFGFVTLATGDLPAWSQQVLDSFRRLSLFPLVVLLSVSYVCGIAVGVPNVILNTGTGVLLSNEPQTGLGFGAAFAVSCAVAAVGLVGGAVAAFGLAKTVFRGYAERLAGGAPMTSAPRLQLPERSSADGGAATPRDTGAAAAGDRRQAGVAGSSSASQRLFRALQRGLGENGVFLSALMRTSLPHVVVNYGLAIVTVEKDEGQVRSAPETMPSLERQAPSVSAAGFPLHKFVLGCVGHAPWIVVYSWLGCSIDSLSELLAGTEDSGSAAARTYAGLAALLLTSIALTCVTRRELRKAMESGEGSAGGTGVNAR
eukprot:g15956.t1